MKNQPNKWIQTWNSTLPILALIGPALFFVASLVRAAGIGTLPGGLSWVSAPEGVIMFIGAPFFVATFIFLGLRIAEKSSKTGIVVTILGILGTAFLAMISGLRVIATILTSSGLDPDAVNASFESEASLVWFIPVLLYNLGQFLAWIITGIVVIRKKLAPWWAGIALILAVPCIITAQALYYNLEVFWPLGNTLWLLGVWGVVNAYQKDMK